MIFKQLALGLLFSILACVVMYVMGSVIGMEWDISKWSRDGRGFWCIFTVCAFPFAFAVPTEHLSRKR